MQEAPVTRTWRAGPAESRDVAELLAGFRDWWGRDAPSAESLLASVERLLRDGEAEFLLGALDGDAPCALCQLRFRFSVWYAAEDCFLEDLFVREDVRRSGLGSALVAAALERARERGCARIELDVNEGNPAALALYEKHGFSAAAEPGAGRRLLLRARL